MILDAIIGLFTSLAACLAAGAAAAFVGVLNLVITGVEVIVGIFVTGFHLKRIEKPRSGNVANTTGGAALALVVIAIIVAMVFPSIMKRKITFVAEDGYSLPFAAVMIHTSKGDLSERTDSAGNVHIPRFSTRALSVKDPRYVDQTWSSADIEARLTVRRTVLGSGLDQFAKRLLAPASDQR